MSNVLVTGGAGFIGANFVYYWHNSYPNDKVVVLDALTYAGNIDTLKPLMGQANFKFVKGNICNTELVEFILKDEDIDLVVHFAAESHVDRSITGPDAFIETNINGTYSMLKACRNVWLLSDKPKTNARFHHISTDEVYGTLGPTDPAFTENTPYAPNSPYSASKASSDLLVRSFFHTYGLKVTTSNGSNNYGYYHFPEKLIPLCLTHIIDSAPLPIYGDGRQIRDWLFVEDHCRGIDLVIKKGRLGESYNIGGINEWANIDIVTLVCKLMDEAFAENPQLKVTYPNSPCAKGVSASSLITYVKDRAGHDRRYAVGTDKIRTELGYKPQETFETGIKKTIKWYLEHETWWRPLQVKAKIAR